MCIIVSVTDLQIVLETLLKLVLSEISAFAALIYKMPAYQSAY